MVFVLDSDLMKFINRSKFGVGIETGMQLDWLITEVHRLILCRKTQLTEKFVRVGEPHVIWMGAPLNVNFEDNENRITFNTSLEKNPATI